MRRLEGFQEACRRGGIRFTHQRMVIFQAVAETDGHPDVETIFLAVRKSIPTISLDTVYRTLWLLRDMGMISTMGPPREKVRFDANTSRHHHFVCSRCGLAEDFYSSEFDELPVPADIKALGKVQGSHVELRGLCSKCMDGERASDPATSQGGKS